MATTQFSERLLVAALMAVTIYRCRPFRLLLVKQVNRLVILLAYPVQKLLTANCHMLISKCGFVMMDPVKYRLLYNVREVRIQLQMQVSKIQRTMLGLMHPIPSAIVLPEH